MGFTSGFVSGLLFVVFAAVVAQFAAGGLQKGDLLNAVIGQLLHPLLGDHGSLPRKPVCSGNGVIYPLVDDGVQPQCTCFGCATGPNCETIDYEGCNVDLGVGDPSLLHQYWALEKPEAHVTIPHYNRPLYRHCRTQMKELDKKVRDLHRRLGNVDPGTTSLFFDLPFPWVLNFGVSITITLPP